MTATKRFKKIVAAAKVISAPTSREWEIICEQVQDQSLVGVCVDERWRICTLVVHKFLFGITAEQRACGCIRATTRFLVGMTAKDRQEVYKQLRVALNIREKQAKITKEFYP